MNEEFNELFDIKDDKQDHAEIAVPIQNVLIHSIVRSVILIITTIVTCGILFIAALGGEINLAILAGVIIISWFGIMIFEAIKLNKKKYSQLATSNVILIAIAVFIIMSLTAYLFNLR